MNGKLIGASLSSLMAWVGTAQAASLQTTSPIDLATGKPIENGTATLLRNADGVELTIDTQGLEPGAYTVWWDIVNNPSACLGECDLEDLLNNTKIELSEFFATGGIVEEDGRGVFTAKIREGELPTGEDRVNLGSGLIDSFFADIFTFIRFHGAVNPELVEVQTTTFNDGCSIAEGDGLFPCSEPQYAFFPSQSVSDLRSVVEPSSLLSLFSLGFLVASSPMIAKKSQN